MATKLNKIIGFIDELLTPNLFRDYCPNGLQVEGTEDICRIVSGVTASQALIDEAVRLNADLLLVHHGFFWKGESETITGMKKRRVKQLLQHDINLVAYHLPLDAHPEVGNNAQLGKILGFENVTEFEPGNPQGLGLIAELDSPITLQQLTERVETHLARTPLSIEGGDHLIKRVGWCTGGAQGYIDKAAALGLDAYLSGEISEPTVHSARENGVHYVAAGHHATERYGVKALADVLADKFTLEHHHVDIDNPV